MNILQDSDTANQKAQKFCKRGCKYKQSNQINIQSMIQLYSSCKQSETSTLSNYPKQLDKPFKRLLI